MLPLLTLPLLTLSAQYTHNSCDVFTERIAACKAFEEFHPGDASSCNFLVQILSAVGYAGYTKPFHQRFTITQVANQPFDDPDSENPRPINYSAQPANHPRQDFDSLCPMYSYGSREPTCCYQPAIRNEDLDVTLQTANFLTFFEVDVTNWRDRIRFRILPRCYQLLKHIPCAVCHPNLSSLLFPVGVETTFGDQYNPVTRRAVRFCSDFALEVYQECKHAIYEKDENHWIVPPGFGERDFLRIVGHKYLKEGKGPLDGLDGSLDVPDATCIDLREWEEIDAAVGRSWVSLALGGMIVVVTLFTLL